jgi:hypothetical protein
VGESPVGEKSFGSRGIPSTTGLEYPCGNPGRPLSKTKYELGISLAGEKVVQQGKALHFFAVSSAAWTALENARESCFYFFK